MVSLVTRRFDPFAELRAMQSQVNRLFEPWARNDQEDLVTGTWIPAVDVEEIGDKMVLRAELPGIKQENIDISFTDGVLTIRGERRFEKEGSERTFHRIERSYGTFVRSFTLPRSVDPSGITASYTDGILTVEVPKREEAKPRQIRIGIGSNTTETTAKQIEK